MRRGPFSDRALIALYVCGELEDRALARHMRLANPTSILAELDQLQLVTASVTDRTTRPPWTWSYRLTAAGVLEARRAQEHAAAEEAAREQRLLEIDQGRRA